MWRSPFAAAASGSTSRAARTPATPGRRESPSRRETAPDEITLDVARALLALPRQVGIHPASAKTILAGIGRFGPWLRHGRTYVSIPYDDDVLTIGLNRAVMLIAEKEG